MTQLVIQAGAGQSGEVETPLRPVVVRATNVLGAPVQGAMITMESISDGGTLAPEWGVTGPDGTASFTWTLGSNAGQQSVWLRAGRAGLEVSATAMGVTLGVGFAAGQFARIPAGSFQMGSVSGGFSNERPVRTVTLSAFRLQRTEVTQGQWRAVMAGTALANPSYFSSCGDTCPVEQVSWFDIQEFLTRLNSQDPGKGYRLPTEAEWEYAARAGTTGGYGIAGSVCSFAWIRNCGASAPRPVDQDPANGWGLRGMHGNVWEWVQDWYGTYPSTPQTNPTGPATETRRANRGGSYFSDSVSVRSAYRNSSTPSNRFIDLGFRLARTP